MELTFNQTEELLIKELDRLKSLFKTYCFSAIKWPKEDHIGSFSDFDLRIIIDTNSEDEIVRINKEIYDIFNNILFVRKGNKRMLEHPPGQIITLNELKLGLGNAIDINSWAFVHGKLKKYQEIKQMYKKIKRTSCEVELLKNNFISRYKNYDLNLEPLYCAENIVKYKKFCLIWHYYAPAIFSAANLLSEKRIVGKSNAIKFLKEKDKRLVFCDKKKLLDLLKDDDSKIDFIFLGLKRDLDLLYTQIKKIPVEQENSKISALHAFVIQNQIFRAKLARYEYYSNKLFQGSPEIINRENNELKIINKIFNKTYKEFKPVMEKLRMDIQQTFYQNINEFNFLLKKYRFNKDTLRYYLEFLKKSIVYFEKLEYVLLQDHFGNISVDSFKIKITPKCTRHCNFCIFSDNKDKEMPYSKFIKIMERSNNFHFNKIFINGGEPTLHTEFEKISRYIYEQYPSKERVIGTNCTVISKSPKILKQVLMYYDTIAIGCDDEHRNLDDVMKVVPIFLENNKTVIINTIQGFISESNKAKLDNFCKGKKIIHVYNSLHHFAIGKRNKIGAPCSKYKNKSLLVLKNGNCFRCYNAVDEKKPEFNLFEKKFMKKLFQERINHYAYCYYCDEYLAKGD